MSRLTGNDAKGLMEAYNAVYAPQQEEVVEEVEQIDEVIRPTTGQQTAPKAAPAPATRPQVAGGGMGGARGSGIRYSTGPSAAQLAKAPAKPAAALTRDQQMLKNLGPAQYAAFKGGGGFAALQKAGGTSDRAALGRVVAQGRQNIGRFDTKPAPAPTAGAKAPAPAPGGAKAPSAAAGATKPAPPQRVVGDGSAAGKPSATPQKSFNPLMQRTFGYQTGNAPSQIAAASAGKPVPSGTALGVAANPDVRKKLNLPAKNLNQDLDMFDLVKGHLLDEGYAETEEAALVIMANMGEEWRKEILDEAKYGTKAGRKALAKKIRKGEKIGKSGPGTGFEAVEKAAKEGGAEDPAAVAAAQMWKTHGGKKG